MSDDHKAITLGITGTIGSGKSAVGAILSDLGVPVIDTDKIVHNLLNTNTEVQNLVTDRFGKSLLIEVQSGAKQIDRKALGALVFNDEQARRDLERILHPRVRQECRRLTKEYATAGATIIGQLVPLLFEANLKQEYDEVWAVIADEKTLRERLKLRDGLNDAEIARRLSAQLNQTEKANRSDKVINNSQDLVQTRQQVETCLHELKVRMN